MPRGYGGPGEPGLLNSGSDVRLGINDKNGTAVAGVMARFPGGSVVKSPPASAEDRGSIPDLGRSHVPRSS